MPTKFSASSVKPIAIDWAQKPAALLGGKKASQPISASGKAD